MVSLRVRDLAFGYGETPVLEGISFAIDESGLEELALKAFNQLSGGQQQKVQIARAIAQQPDILLLDEPVANLDIKHQHEVMNLLTELIREKKIICLVVIHDLNMALKYMDDLILMQNGSICSAGIPSEVLSKQNLKRVYGIDVKRLHAEGLAYIAV